MRVRTIPGALLALTAAACSQQDKKPRLPMDVVVGRWRTASSGGTLPQIELRADSGGSAELTVTALGGGRAVARGTWDGADSLVRVVVRMDTGIPRPTSVLFALRGGALAATTVNGPLLGPDALGRRLTR
jgi:hypothetical protein